MSTPGRPSPSPAPTPEEKPRPRFRFSWRMTAAVEHWLSEHPDDADAASVRQRSAFMRASYVAYGRDTLGFGLYLFRAP